MTSSAPKMATGAAPRFVGEKTEGHTPTSYEFKLGGLLTIALLFLGMATLLATPQYAGNSLCPGPNGPGWPEVGTQTRMVYCIGASGGEIHAVGSSDRDEVVIDRSDALPGGLVLKRRGQTLLVNDQPLQPQLTYTDSRWLPSFNPWLWLTVHIVIKNEGMQAEKQPASTDALQVSGNVYFNRLLSPVGPLALGLGIWMMLWGLGQPAAAAKPKADPPERAEQARPGWMLWFWWVLATTGGWIAGWVATQVLGSLASGARGLSATWAGAIVGTTLGGMLGVMQWVPLRRRISKETWWMWASIVGWAVGLVIAVGTEVASSTLSAAMMGAIGGAVAGTLQWIVLRRQVSRAGRWVLASAVGWAMGCGIIGVAGPKVHSMAEFVLTLAWSGAAGGAITGIALVWLLRQPRKV
jgi:hypothetical protein